MCVELAESANPLPQFIHPKNGLSILGVEDASPKKLVNNAHGLVYISIIGSMKLAATVNVLMYDRLAKEDLDRPRAAH